MQADAGFVQNIHGAYQAAAQGKWPVDAGAILPWEGIALAVQGEVPQSYVLQRRKRLLISKQALGDFVVFRSVPGSGRTVPAVN